MCVNPGQYHLFEMGVVQAALSCFSGPSTRICRFVLFELGDGVVILPGSRVPSLRGDILSERNRPFWLGMGGELGHRFFPLGRAYVDWGRSSQLSPCFAQLSLGRSFVQAFCCPRRKAVRSGCKRLAFILLISGHLHFQSSGNKCFPISLGGLLNALLYSLHSVSGFLFPRGM